jgi:hypothetical protein
MKCRRKIALLASSAFVLQSLLAVLPMPAAADDGDLAGFVYWKLPLGGSDQKPATPTFGFSMVEAKNVWLMPSGDDPDVEFVPPALVDLSFSGGDEFKLPSLSLSGIDVGAMFDNALYADTGPAPHTGEWILIGGGIGLGGLIACAALGCFGGSDHNHAAASAPPTGSAAAVGFTDSAGLDAPALGMASSF